MKTILYLLLFPGLALAQTETLGHNDLRDRAFRMAKATIEFLATDTKTYGYQDKTTCPDCVSYPSLKTFIVQQKLTKADELVNETERWAAAPVTLAKDPALALAELRTQLMSRVTSGNERQHRRSLPSFATYESQMNQLAGRGSAGRGPAEEPVPAAIAMNGAGQNSDVPDASADQDDAQSDSGGIEADIVVSPNNAQVANNSWLSKSGLALILSLLSLGLAGWLLTTRRKDLAGGRPADAGSDMKVAQLNDELMHVKGDLRRAIDAYGKLQNRVEQLENQVSVLQKAVSVASAVPTLGSISPNAADTGVVKGTANVRKDGQPVANQNPMQRQQTQPGTTTSTAPTAPTPAPRPLQNVSQAPPPPQAPPAENRPRTPAPAQNTGSVPAPSNAAPPITPQILYARTVDLGDGFSVDSLSEKTSERPMVYQIQVQTPGQATFRVADDPYAQRLALSDPYSYLNDACEYNSQPAPNSRIQTIKPGRLTLQTNKWVIMEKAQISFT